VDPVDLGTIKNVAIQEVWPREASDFTPWLASNLSYLSDKLDMELTADKTEAPVGDFSADIIARDLSTNRIVVIENQFGQSDHRHLGQIITYAAGRGATAVVWVAQNIRPEHRVAIDLLNRGMKSVLQFYAVEVSVIKIDNSRPAFTLDVICAPEEEDQPSTTGNELPEKYQKYLTFFQGLLDELNRRHFTRARKAQAQSWYTFSSENSSVYTYAVSFARHERVRAEVYINSDDANMNKQLFDVLFAEKQALESSMGTALEWERLDERRASRIAVYRPGSIESPTEELQEIQAWAIANLERFKSVFPTEISKAWASIQAGAPGGNPD
jgi:hypothetical protein